MRFTAFQGMRVCAYEPPDTAYIYILLARLLCFWCDSTSFSAGVIYIAVLIATFSGSRPTRTWPLIMDGDGLYAAMVYYGLRLSLDLIISLFWGLFQSCAHVIIV